MNGKWTCPFPSLVLGSLSWCVTVCLNQSWKGKWTYKYLQVYIFLYLDILCFGLIPTSPEIDECLSAYFLNMHLVAVRFDPDPCLFLVIYILHRTLTSSGPITSHLTSEWPSSLTHVMPTLSVLISKFGLLYVFFLFNVT